MTPEQKQAIERFQAWVSVQPNLTQAKAGKLVGVSGATLSQLFAGKYPGNVAKIAARIARFLAREERKRRAPKRPGFAPTSVSERVIGTLRLAHDEGVMVLVMGSSGAGKTTAIEQYLLAEPECVRLSATPSTRSRALVEQLSRALGLDWQGSTSRMALRCADELRGTGRLVIVDEADYLPEPCLQELRIIHDRSGCGLALIATPAFLERLRRRKSSTINQFLGRLAYAESVTGITETDAEEILSPFGLSRPVVAALTSQCQGSARRLVWALAAAQRQAAGQSLAVEHVHDAYAALLSG